MVPGNRKLIVASTLLALPVALMMVSLTNGTSPDAIQEAAYVPTQANRSVVHASAADISGIEQALGSQPESGSAVQQVGLLETLTERRANPKPTSSTAKSPASNRGTNSATNESAGLLSTLFSTNSRPQPTPTAAKPADVERPPADWNGIPFHEPKVVASSKSGVPIRDPSAQNAATRIISSGAPKEIQAIPASARRETRIIVPPAPVARVIRPAAVPTPQPIPTVTASRSAVPVAPLSVSNSSRRSDRRTVGVMTADRSDAQTSASSSASSEISAPAPQDELVPKVSRRELPKNEEETTGNVKVDPSTAPADAVAVKTEVPQKPTKAVANAPTEAKVPSGELTSKPAAAEPVAVTATAKSTLSPPAPVPQTLPYSTPTDSTTAESLPIAGIPLQPYAASTPSAAVSHRSGPPATDFQPREDIVQGSSNSQFGAVASPIGSGLLPQLPEPTSRSAADAYIAAAPQGIDGSDRAYVPTNAIRSTVDPYANAIAPQQKVPPSMVPMHTTAPAYTNDIGGFDDAPSTPDLRDGTTRRLKPGDTAVASELPGIRVVTNGPSEIMIRQTQQYEIRVENRGSIDAQGVMVRAMIPDWAEIRGHNATQGRVSPQSKNSSSQDAFGIGAGERLVWTLDSLPAGATERMFISLRAERSGSHGVDVDWTLVPQKSVTKVHVHEPQLSLVIDGPPQVTYGQSQAYKVRVMNPGDGIAPNVVFTLSPNSATPQTQKIGDIPAGKEAQFEVELTAQDLGDLKIHGLASGDLELRAEATKTIRVAAAKLEAILNGPEVKYQNTEAVYQLQVKNNGNAMTEQVVATLQLPGGAKYLGGIADSLQRGQTIKWKIDSLAPNATRDYEFRCNLGSTGDQLFSFDCQGTAAAQTSVSIATRVESIADLVMTINDPVAPAPVSTEVSYEIIVHNRGSRDATDVRAIAQFSHGIEPKRLEGHSGEVLTGQVLFDPIPRIGAGEQVTLRIVAEADRAGHHRFRSEIRSGATVLVAEEATHFMDPKSERVSRSSSDQVLR